MTFTGIPVEALDFYEDLEVDNTKSFWTRNKSVYENSVRGPVRALADALAPEFGAVHFFRPHRDVRFAKDKSPYKTQQGVTVGPHYLHISAAGLFVAVGYYRMSPDQVARYRNAVDVEYSGTDLTRRVADLRGSDYVVDGDALKTRPRDYPADHPRIDLLRYRSLVGHTDLGAPPWLHTAEAVEQIAARWRDLAPLQQWLDDHVGPAEAT
ncbi:uncharacterized protein (TIGR02453 family) [Haloactinopolyspora alba]|uniref:Uncharacterized protein (TIGR02453 family) n=1 Tax=Haloactinopolyspora alba TaxID=648780 RepID=A0A2P8DV68_9ACTN|nr:DUF2461 domain-containing protein [Haloactinopolyspora alba]PSL01110.1 uncharacterized protein (TIGR02453 family) [Haloactinopolyspora alba]